MTVSCRSDLRRMLERADDQKGLALVITLLALALVTAMVVEFSYAVYTGTNNLYNWRDSQRLSLMSRSGINVLQRHLQDLLTAGQIRYPSMEFPVANPFDYFAGEILVRIEDEHSKFNVNTIVFSQRSERNEIAYASFRRLLQVLSLDEKIADHVVEWIIKRRESGLSASGTSQKYYVLPSTDELLLIDGISRKDYDTLLPYVTVYGPPNDISVNVNGAGKPVLMSISDPRTGEFPITEDRAERIIQYRSHMPFENFGQFNNYAVTNFSSDRVATEGRFFTVKSIASSGGIKRIIETVCDTSTGKIIAANA